MINKTNNNYFVIHNKQHIIGVSPLVSIITPIFNGEKYIDSYFQMLFAQTYKNIEIICIDDKSTDTTLHKLEQYRQRDSRIKILHNTSQIFAGESRNKAINIAKGKYILFLDIDDLYNDIDSIYRFVKISEKYNLNVCKGGLKILNENQQTISVNVPNSVYDSKLNLFNFQRYIYNRKFIIDNNLFFPTKFSQQFEDVVFLLNVYLANKKEFYTIPDIQYVYIEKYHWKTMTKSRLISYFNNVGLIFDILNKNDLYTNEFYGKLTNGLFKQIEYSIQDKFFSDKILFDQFLQCVFNIKNNFGSQLCNSIKYLIKTFDIYKLFDLIGIKSIQNDILKLKSNINYDVQTTNIYKKPQHITTIAIWYRSLIGGGIQTYINNFVKLLQNDYKLVVIYSDGENPYEHDQQYSNISFVKIDYESVDDLAIIISFIVKIYKIDCLYNQEINDIQILKLYPLIANALNIYFVQHVHQSVKYFIDDSNNIFFKQQIYNTLYNYRNIIDCCIVLSKHTEYLFNNVGIKSIYIPNFIYDSENTLNTTKIEDKDKNLLIWCGRISDQKKPLDAIQAFIHLHQMNNDLKLLFCYTVFKKNLDKNLKTLNEIKTLCQQHNLANSVKFIEDNKNINQFFQKANAMIYTSKFDGFPMVFLEALNNKVKIASYQQDELDILKLNSNIVSETFPNDPYKLAISIKSLLDIKLNDDDFNEYKSLYCNMSNVKKIFINLINSNFLIKTKNDFAIDYTKIKSEYLLYSSQLKNTNAKTLNNKINDKQNDDLNPLVSIVIPTYNVEKYISQCIESILQNEYENIEILCIDDNSTDDTINILKKYCEIDKRIKIIYTGFSKNIFAGSCRNIGIDVAQGKYIYFCDADDYIRKDLISKCVVKMQTTGAQICIFYNYNDLNDGLTPAVDLVRSNKLKKILKFMNQHNKNIINIHELDGTICSVTAEPWTKFFRRDFIFRNKFRYQNIHNSNDFYFIKTVAYNATKITVIDDALYFYRRNVVNSVSRYKSNYGSNILDSVQKLLNETIDINKTPIYDIQSMIYAQLKYYYNTVLLAYKNQSNYNYYALFKDFIYNNNDKYQLLNNEKIYQLFTSIKNNFENEFK